MAHRGGKAAGKGKKPAGKADKGEDTLQAVVRVTIRSLSLYLR